jgi:predicted DNA-binding protein (MmcQ/YjbR family)
VVDVRYTAPMAAYIDWVRKFCLSLPHVTEKVRWEHNLLFCVGEKMFCAANLEPGMGPSKISFKCSPEKFAELVEVEGIIPAPYSARLFWVSMTDADALRQNETHALIREAYEIVRSNLPKKLQASLMAKDETLRGSRKSRAVATPPKVKKIAGTKPASGKSSVKKSVSKQKTARG